MLKLERARIKKMQNARPRGKLYKNQSRQQPTET